MTNIYEKLFSQLLEHKWDDFIDTLEKNKDNIDININDKNNNKMLTYAIIMNKPDIVQLLIDYGARIDITDNENRTIAYYPIVFHFNEILDILLKANNTSIGLSLLHNTNINSKTILNYAIDVNNIYAIKKILEYGGDPNIKDMKGYNSLHYVIYTRDIDTIKLIAEKITDINAFCQTGETALHIATNFQLSDICTLFLNMKANVNIQDVKYEFTPLHYCVSIGDTNIMNILLDNHANPNLQDIYGNTPLHYCISENSNSCLMTLINYKYKNYVLNYNLWNNQSMIPIHIFFVDYSDEKIYYINKLISMSNINFKDNNGNNLLHYLAMHNLWKKYKSYILIKKLDIYSKNNNNKSVLDYIKKEDFDEFINLATESYINRLKRHPGIWIDKTDQLCSLEFDKLENNEKEKFENNKINFDNECKNKVKNNIIKKWKNNTCEFEFGSKINNCVVNINNNNNVNICTFTGSTLDVLVGLIYILHKYPFSCSTSTKNIINNNSLCNFYKENGLMLNDKCEFLNFEILWINYKLYIMEEFHNIFTKCIKNGKRFIIIPLGIEVTNNNHANYIIYDNNINEIERFEPHGMSGPVGMNYNPTLLDSILRERFRKLNMDIKYVSPYDYLPKIGFQLFDNYEKNKKKIGDPGGFCALWSIWYVDMRLAYPDIDRKVLVKTLIKTIHNTNNSFKDVIRNYSIEITSLRDKLLKYGNIDINDWMNDNYNSKQYEKLINAINSKLYSVM
jgi:ankyrin repeat protein